MGLGKFFKIDEDFPMESGKFKILMVFAIIAIAGILWVDVPGKMVEYKLEKQRTRIEEVAKVVQSEIDKINATLLMDEFILVDSSGLTIFVNGTLAPDNKAKIKEKIFEMQQNNPDVEIVNLTLSIPDKTKKLLATQKNVE